MISINYINYIGYQKQVNIYNNILCSILTVIKTAFNHYWGHIFNTIIVLCNVYLYKEIAYI